MRELITWYWLGGRKVKNLGEHLVDLLLPHFGCRPRSFDQAKAQGDIRPGEHCLLMIGSEFHVNNLSYLTGEGCRVHVWGQGNGRGAHTAVDMRLPKYRKHVTVHALRGPLTKRVSHVEQDVPLLDPGFLLPAFFPREQWDGGAEPSGVVYVPHHANTARVSGETAAAIGAGAILDVMVHRDGLGGLIGRILSAEFALVNSLHALILCLAYRVPCAICLTAGETLNMPDKWRDVLESLGWSEGGTLPIVHDLDQGRRWWEAEGRHLAIPDTTPLIEAFPWK